MRRILRSDWLHLGAHLARTKNILKLAVFPTRHFQTIATRNYLTTVEPLLWDTFIQGAPSFKGHKIWSRKNVHIIFVFVTSFEGTPLFRGKGHCFWVPKPGFNLHSGDTLALTTKIVDKFKWLPVKMTTAFKQWTISLKITLLPVWNSAHNIAEIS